ncbi:MAG: ABC transporter substrate-binding protein [Sphingomonas sp.]
MRIIPLGALVATFAMTGPSLAQATDPAQAPIHSLDDGLLGIMKNKAAGVKGRAATIAPVIDRVYDIPLMTRLSVGSAWPTIAPGDQSSLVTAFRRMTIAQYASNFDAFSGESFSIDPKIETRGADKLIRTTLNVPKGAPVAIAYRLRQSGGSWKVIDVFYRNSISQLATKRADFAGVLSSGGAKALIAHLNALSAKAGG